MSFFISRRKHEEELAIKEKEITDRLYREREEWEMRRYMDNELVEIRRRLGDLEMQVADLRGVKESYNKVCDAVTNASSWR